MDTFFTFLKKSLVAMMFVMFAFVATYIPQDWNKVETVHAGGLAGGALEVTQLAQKIADGIFQTIANGYAQISAWASNNLWIKEFKLDGIAWAIAKTIISSMVQDLVQWINSGFEGSPMFVQDLEGFLRNAADVAIGGYIEELGGSASFLCDPFKLDIQVAVALQYQKSRVYQPADKCTLTGVIDNIEGFMSGVQGSFSEGGWNDWFDITSKPEVYTPYGAQLAAQTGATVRILNTKGEEAAKLEWGAGFLSGEICEMVDGAGTPKEECFISKPGKIIQEALTFNLDSGRQSLITADEFNEIIAALLGQLANTALTGAAGLLGLSGGTGHTYTGFSSGTYLGDMSNSSLNTLTGDLLATMKDARDTQMQYRTLAGVYQPQLFNLSIDPDARAATREAAAEASDDALAIITTTTNNITKLDTLIADYEVATGS
ncbi:MAG: hypothetical protein RL097_759, partial [Candidatus Parcubacteria bacterium]